MILVESEEAAANLAVTVEDTVADGSLEEQVNDAAPQAKMHVSEEEGEEVSQGTLQEADTPAVSASPSTAVRASQGQPAFHAPRAVSAPHPGV